MTDVVQSPCTAVCTLDVNDVCIGCGRTASEIGAYGFASNEERRAINKKAEKRLVELETA